MSIEPRLRRAALAALLVASAACASRHRPVADPSPEVATSAARTVRDGVYTEAQSRRGETIYFTICVACHKAELTGADVVPPLAGDLFLSRWSRQTVGDLFEQVKKMPPTPTARLSAREYSDVLAYVLSRNRFPAGSEELAADYAALREIRVALGE